MASADVELRSCRRTRVAWRSRMPLYDYECHGCGHRFSEVMSIGEHEKRQQRCSKCGSEDTEPLIAAAHVVTAKKS